jgi:hypothetical protein
MILVRLKGGLGNQLFQYAAALQLQRLSNSEIQFFIDHLTIFETKRSFKLDFLFDSTNKVAFNKPSIWYRLVLKYNLNRVFPFLFANIITEKNLQSPAKHEYYIIDGYFQDVTKIEYGIKEISKIITKYDINELARLSPKSICEDIFIDSAAIHIRQGDYLNASNINTYYILNNDYYRNALLKLPLSIKTLYLFSDTENPNIHFDSKFKIIQIGKMNLTDVDEFLLMSKFPFVIIANSTFSFWASLVNHQNKKIIAPSQWIKNDHQNSLWVKNMDLLGYNICDIY